MADTKDSNHASVNEMMMMGQSKIFSLPRSGIVMSDNPFDCVDLMVL